MMRDLMRDQPTAAELQEIEATIQQAVAAAQQAVANGLREGRAAADARAAAQDARADARNARDQAADQATNQAANQAAEGQPRDEPSFNVRFGEGGLVVTRTNDAGTTVQQPFDPSTLIPPQAKDILLISVLGVIGMIMAFPIGRAIARYIDRRGVSKPIGNDVGTRLAAIEQAVDAVAIEMERMSEANRFTTKLLTQHVAAPDFAAARQHAGAAQPVAPRG